MVKAHNFRSKTNSKVLKHTLKFRNTQTTKSMKNKLDYMNIKERKEKKKNLKIGLTFIGIYVTNEDLFYK